MTMMPMEKILRKKKLKNQKKLRQNRKSKRPIPTKLKSVESEKHEKNGLKRMPM